MASAPPVKAIKDVSNADNKVIIGRYREDSKIHDAVYEALSARLCLVLTGQVPSQEAYLASYLTSRLA
jgi:hypothetical protein